MPDVISSCTHKARKEHQCQLCNRKINAGEEYDRQVNKFDGTVYTFKSHKQCSEISSHLWNYIDPDEGMTDEDFIEGVGSYCYNFVCPECTDKEEGEYGDCKKDTIEDCLSRIHDRLIKKGSPKREGYKWVDR
jgi:hypothetical protein